jgi:hypothetical protein
MIIIGADYHPVFRQIAFVDTDTGELQERRLEHREDAEKFYRDLAAQKLKLRVGMEASGHARWFEGLLAELQFERLDTLAVDRALRNSDKANLDLALSEMQLDLFSAKNQADQKLSLRERWAVLQVAQTDLRRHPFGLAYLSAILLAAKSEIARELHVGKESGEDS